MFSERKLSLEALKAPLFAMELLKEFDSVDHAFNAQPMSFLYRKSRPDGISLL